MGKKFFLFSLFAFLAAGFGFGGVSMADCTVTDSTITVGNDCNLANAITTANSNQASSLTISLPAGEHTLSNSINFEKSITIKGVEKGSNTDYTSIIVPSTPYNGGQSYANKMSDSGIKLGNLSEGVTLTFENVKFGLDGNVSGYGFLGGSNSKVIINASTVAGRLSTFTDMEFNTVKFIKYGETTYATYNMDIHEGSNIVFNTCSFEQKDRNINIYDFNNHSNDNHNVTFNNCTFKTTAQNKGAIVIHESHSKQGHAVNYKVNINNADISAGHYPNNAEVIWREIPDKGEGYFTKIVAANGLVMIDDIRRVIATQGGEITVTVKDNGNNTIYSYSTPKTKEVNVNADSKEELKAVINWYRSEGFCVGNLEGEELTAGSQELTITEAGDDAEAKIGDKKYCKLDDAIEFAEEDGAVIEILKTKDGGYTLPATIDKKITIKKGSNLSKSDEVIINVSGAGKSNGEALITLTKDITFEGLTINFVSTDDWKYLNNGTKVTMKHCTIKGVMYIRGNMDFENCTFNGANSDAYQIHINYGNVNFTKCTFNTSASRFINIAWGGDGKYTISFKDSTFSTDTETLKKAAVMVHELRGEYSTTDPFDLRGGTINKIEIDSKNYGKGQWNLIFDNTVIANDSKPFSDAYIGNSQLFGVDTVYVNTVAGDTYSYAAPVDPTKVTLSDYSLGSENGGEVNVTVDGTKVYSTPKRGAVHKVTFDGANETNVADGSKVAKPDDPTKSCYHFDGWTTDGNTAYDFNSVVTSDLALTSKWTYTCSSSSGGGGGSSKKSETTKTDDAKANTGDTATVDDKNAEDKNDETKADEPKTAVDANKNGNADTAISFSQEFKDAYKFARENGITTKDSIEEADMYGPLTRIAMAKMLSQYAINVLGKTPDTTKVVPTFPDVSAQLDADYNNGVTLAYQLGIMGIGIEEFRPFAEVTRAEFGTALSRMLYGTADGEGNEWYSTHLEKLMNEKIITNDNPQLKELRGYVMIMLMRSAKQ